MRACWESRNVGLRRYKTTTFDGILPTPIYFDTDTDIVLFQGSAVKSFPFNFPGPVPPFLNLAIAPEPPVVEEDRFSSHGKFERWLVNSVEWPELLTKLFIILDAQQMKHLDLQRVSRYGKESTYYEPGAGGCCLSFSNLTRGFPQYLNPDVVQMPRCTVLTRNDSKDRYEEWDEDFYSGHLEE